jgi:hypothetical protein
MNKSAQEKNISHHTKAPPLEEFVAVSRERIVAKDDLSQETKNEYLILDGRWQVSRTHEETTHQLVEAIFEHVKFFPDSANIFPTVQAYKS